MKNIGFITMGLGFGGAEKMLCFIANELSKRGNKIFVFNLNTVPDYVSDRFQYLEESVKVFEVSNENCGLLSQINAITRLTKEIGIDVLVGFTSKPSMIAKIAGIKAGIPSIMSERGDPTKTTSKTLKAALIRCIISFSNGGVFQTEGAKALYGRRLQKRGTVIPNPIFVNGDIEYVDYEHREKSVVSVGRLDNYQKRYDIMLDAFKIFSDKHNDYVLKLYGRGADEELIRSWVKERGIEEKVQFMGVSSQPMKDISKDGMFLITSDFEGISNSLLEAMAVGLPCVSTDHTPGGARLLITDHENGLLAPIGDSEALAKAMCEFADNHVLAKKCGEHAKKVLVRFAPEKIIDSWETYINKICK